MGTNLRKLCAESRDCEVPVGVLLFAKELDQMSSAEPEKAARTPTSCPLLCDAALGDEGGSDPLPSVLSSRQLVAVSRKGTRRTGAWKSVMWLLGSVWMAVLAAVLCKITLLVLARFV